MVVRHDGEVFGSFDSEYCHRSLRNIFDMKKDLLEKTASLDGENFIRL